MQDAMRDGWANPSSVHAPGRRSRALLEDARRAVAEELGARPADVVLTSGGTEAVNLGVLRLGRGVSRVITTAVEHPAVAESVGRLESLGVEVWRAPVPNGVAPDASELADRISADTLVAVQWVNHETGTMLPVPEWARAVRARGARLFVDATQALGVFPVDVVALGADAVAVASHKIGGPGGAGALFVDRRWDIEPLLAGGAQERGRRPGAPDTPAQAGFGEACRHLGHRRARVAAASAARDRLEAYLIARGAVVNGAGAPRVPTVCNASVPSWSGQALVAALDLEGLCASSGAACSSGLAEPSPVVGAMYPEEPWRAACALRLSLGPETTDREVEGALSCLERVLSRGPSRAPSPDGRDNL